MCLRVGRVDHLDLGVLGLRGQLSHDRGKHAHPAPTLPTVESDKFEPVSARTVRLILMPRRDRATQPERRRG